MFRHKDRYLKSKRLEKKENNNKEDKQNIKDEKYNYYDSSKAIQQFISDEYNIKVHVNEIRQIKYVINNNHTCNIKNNTLNNKIYNTSNENLNEIINEINNKNIPIDWNYKHDKTRWNNNKLISKQLRNNDLKKFKT